MIHLHSIAEYISYLSKLSYPSIFLAILSSGHIIPIPESVTLLLLGYIASVSHAKILGLLITALLATIVVDLIMYAISLGGSNLAKKIEKRINIDWIEQYKTVEEKRLFLLVFASHFVPGWRFANPVIAGVTKMPWKKFALYTVLSSLIYAPLFILAGFFFNKDILPLITTVESVRQVLLYALIIGALLLIGTFLQNNKKGYNNSHAKK